MNIERLKHLITVLEKVEPERFDLNGWVSSCGAAACAVGWAARDAEFQRQGLTLDVWEHDSHPTFARYESWDAVRRFFDLSSRESMHLFSLAAYDTDEQPHPSHVIARIRELIGEPA